MLLGVKEAERLVPVLDALLETGASAACARLLPHLDDALLELVLRCLRALLLPTGRRSLPVPPGQLSAVRAALLPHKKLFLRLARPATIARKRAQLARGVRTGGKTFARVLAGFIRTLRDHLAASKGEKRRLTA